MTGPFVPPDALSPAAPQAASVARLFFAMLGIAGVVFVIVMALALVALARRRRDGEDPRDPARTRTAERWVAIGGGVTAAILVALVAASVSASRALSSQGPEKARDALQVEVTGHQWWWEVRYPDPDPTRIFSLANEIHVPVGRPVRIALEATDVIHSFWVPNLSGKKDLIPGRRNELWITAAREGIYRGQCAEFCGMEHARMGFRLVAERPELYEAWAARQRSPAPEPADAAAARGRQVFLAAPCALCHTVAGTDAHGTNGPDLTHVAGRLTLGAGTLPNDLPRLTAWVVDAPSLKPGVNMPRNLLPAEDLDALTAYLETLK